DDFSVGTHVEGFAYRKRRTGAVFVTWEVLDARCFWPLTRIASEERLDPRLTLGRSRVHAAICRVRCCRQSAIFTSRKLAFGAVRALGLTDLRKQVLSGIGSSLIASRVGKDRFLLPPIRRCVAAELYSERIGKERRRQRQQLLS